ncbi:CRISPR-associated endonuclease Cas1 [Rheinheimera sediminis]|uniref:CRISPR-associated endonuclease Cas1 n=1 Tax=Rheinheimera sp. YQF-1 TaxID=2499626 RepID=UPI000FDC5DC2|nr:CRISPR-associated endonuclease Cas1 [Rheinheimera sp. YQF-1]RVT47832.1 CRISPR-associated endonuclease Cas1 [Rheinheimera sp. YQF-1]
MTKQSSNFPFHRLQPQFAEISLLGLLNQSNLELAFKKVSENNGVAGLDGVTIAQFAQRLPQELQKLQYEITNGRYKAQPCKVVEIPKANQKFRRLAIPCIRDRVVQTMLSQALMPFFEPHFERCSYGYRPGRSYIQAVQQICRFRDQGFAVVFDADIEQYFDGIPQDYLLAQLADYLPDPALLGLIERSLQQMQWHKNQLVYGKSRGIGVPQGSPLSPVLANLYLDPLDEALLSGDYKPVRFADDFIVMCQNQKSAAYALALTREVLDQLKLCFNADKTRVTDFEHGFVFLGHYFIEQWVEPIKKLATQQLEYHAFAPLPEAEPATTAAQAAALLGNESLTEQGDDSSQQEPERPLLSFMQREIQDLLQPEDWPAASAQQSDSRLVSKLRCLYVSRQGAVLHKVAGKIEVRSGDKVLSRQPLAQLDCILCYGAVHLTRAVLHYAMKTALNVVFMSRYGGYYGQLQSSNCYTPELLQRCLELHQQPLPLAAELVRAKLLNQLTVLRRLARYRQKEGEGFARLLLQLTDLTQKASQAKDINQLRGYEGQFAKVYFAVLKSLISPEWNFTQRNRRPPKDPVNLMLSVGYALLFNHQLAFLHHRQLPVNLGYLHQGYHNQPALALDLMEPFRAPVVDATVLQLIFSGVLTPVSFSYQQQECVMDKTAWQLLVGALEAKLQKQVQYRALNVSTDYRRVMDLQTALLKQHLLNPEQAFKAFRVR